VFEAESGQTVSVLDHDCESGQIAKTLADLRHFSFIKDPISVTTSSTDMALVVAHPLSRASCPSRSWRFLVTKLWRRQPFAGSSSFHSAGQTRISPPSVRATGSGPSRGRGELAHADMLRPVREVHATMLEHTFAHYKQLIGRQVTTLSDLGHRRSAR